MPDQPKPPDAPLPFNVTNVLGNIIGILPQPVDINQVLQVLNAALNIQSIEEYNQQLPALKKAVQQDLPAYLKQQSDQLNSTTTALNNTQTQLNVCNSANQDLQNQVASLNAQIAQLKAQLAAQPQKALPLDVAQSFQQVVNKIQSDARAASGPQATITNMQIAVKALLNVQDGTQPGTKEAVLVFPDPSQPPDPNLLSTLTVNFGAIPNLKSAAPPPGPSSSSSSSASSSSASPSPVAAGEAGEGGQPPAPAPVSVTSVEGPSTPEPPGAKKSVAQRLMDRLRGFGSGPQKPGS